VLFFSLVLIDELTHVVVDDPCCSRWPGGAENGMHELVMTSVEWALKTMGAGPGPTARI
jgi:hypothetical protein